MKIECKKHHFSSLVFFSNLQKQLVLVKNEIMCKEIYWGKTARLRPYYDHRAGGGGGIRRSITRRGCKGVDFEEGWSWYRKAC